MARIRTIKPEFFLHDVIGDLKPLTRLLFIGLWTQADREGRLHDRPRRLKASLLPYDSVSMDGALNELAEAGFIIRYSDNGDDYIEIPTFSEHQYPNQKEQESKIPAYDPDTMQARCKHGTSTPLIGKGKEGKGKDICPDFDTFWAAYPRKEKKGDARKAFDKAIRKTTLDTMLAGIERYKRSEAFKKGYVRLPATWLNSESWDDEGREVDV